MKMKDIQDWLDNKPANAPKEVGEATVDVDGVSKIYPAQYLDWNNGAFLMFFGYPGGHPVTEGLFIRILEKDLGKEIILPDPYALVNCIHNSQAYGPESGTLTVYFDASPVTGEFNVKVRNGAPVSKLENGKFCISPVKT
ncbi:hypothetical protein T3H00_02260 [Pseudomonas fluorescens]|jgi:hypothetical protein|uniref:hypothetical protein n=1 Tax=Pseudomonas TaxID=286 RepID=UPI001A927B1C|nr:MULTISPECIES: hypothetical protein [Pseudomonas]MDZ5431491.1 hypothetical protein [Pseudomonas fluorescens]